jgi:hypothetical protein
MLRTLSREIFAVYCANHTKHIKALNHRPLTAEIRVQSQTTPCEICCERSGAGTGFCQDFSLLPVTISPSLHTYCIVVCSCQYNNTDSCTKLLDGAVSEGMSRFRVCRFRCVQDTDVAQRTDRSRVIVNYVGGKLCKIFVILKEEHGARVRSEVLGTRGGRSGRRMGRAARWGAAWVEDVDGFNLAQDIEN